MDFVDIPKSTGTGDVLRSLYDIQIKKKKKSNQPSILCLHPSGTMEEKVKEFIHHNTTGRDESEHGSEIRNSVLLGAGLSLSNHDITL